MKENPSQDILTMVDLEAAAKTEHYEIASYTSLIEKCNLMGQQQCAQLLQQNPQQEQAMLQRVTRDSQQFGRQMIGQAGMDRMSQSSQDAQAGVLERRRASDPLLRSRGAQRGAQAGALSPPFSCLRDDIRGATPYDAQRVRPAQRGA